MIPLRSPLIALVALCAVTCAAAAEKPPLPPISGELSGKFSAPKLTNFPEVQWKTSIRALGGTKAHAEISATAPGGRLRAGADFDVLTGAGSWKITDGELDAATWFAVIAPEIGGAAAGLKAVGTLRVEGGGVLKKNRPVGNLKLVWDGGALRNPDQGWALEDIALRGEYEVDAGAYTVKSAGPLEVTVRTITTTRFGARNVFVRGRLNEGGTFSLLVARVEIAGGEITVDPCTVPLMPPVMDFNVHIDRIGLQDVVALVPASLSDARGRVDGVVRIGWSAAAGIQLGAGNISLRNDEPAMVRLTAAPGFLTKRLSERIALLPAWTGPLARWLAPVNPAYGDLRAIELGRTDLQVKELNIELTPEGDAFGRTAKVYVRGRPAQVGGSVKEVTFQVNVAGPLAAVLGVGLKQVMSVRFE